MRRCLWLAEQGAGYVAPNPLVGAVLVYQDRIIGEGYHQHYGQAHAEVNCINSVKDEDKALIAGSTMYVSLEPCAHFGKTPPCADLIIGHKIPTVVIGCRDPFEAVNGKGIEKLLNAGIEIRQGVLEHECMALNKRFFTFHLKRRPYIILKWAQTDDGKITNNDSDKRLLISNEYSNRLVHQWRSQEAGILIGTNTASLDDPELTTRLWPGPSPARLVVDIDLRLPSRLKIFDGKRPTIVFNKRKHTITEERVKGGGVYYYKLTNDKGLISQLAEALYQLKINSVLVEGGAKLLQSFIDANCWDEARVVVNTGLTIDNGLPAPVILHSKQIKEFRLLNDSIKILESVSSASN